MKKILQQDIEKTNFLLSHYETVCDRQRFWHIRNNTFKIESCQICNNLAHFSKTRFLYTYCSKQCSKKGFAKKLHDKAVNKSLIVLVEKKCNLCEKIKPVSEFYTNGKSKITGKYNIRSFCKVCSDIKGKESYIKFKEDRANKQRLYYENNPGSKEFCLH